MASNHYTSDQIQKIGDEIYSRPVSGEDRQGTVMDAEFVWDLAVCAHHLENKKRDGDTVEFFLWIAKKVQINQLGEMLNAHS